MTQLSTSMRINFLSSLSPTSALYIGESKLFSAIRQHMRDLFTIIYYPERSPMQNEAAILLRMEMMKWLTSPLMPNIEFLSKCGLENETHIRRQWGDSAVQVVLALKRLINLYREEGSVLNKMFIETFCDLTSEFGQDRLKIWCHRNERALFCELLEGLITLEDHKFICSLTEYRHSLPIDALILFGPLRTQGMSMMPEALITSPIYRRLVRFIWNGLNDENDFGNDPIFPKYSWLETMSSVKKSVICSAKVDIYPLNPLPTDDIDFYIKNQVSASGSYRCVLVELSEEHGVLLRLGTEHLVFSPHINDNDAIIYLHINDVEEGDYLLIHDADADLGSIHVDASQARLATRWKKALADQYERDPNLCVQKMKKAGISLINLHRAVESWVSMSGSVIHAPQRRDHFKALLTDVIEPETITSQNENEQMILDWQLAWREVATSRATAIEHGVAESSIVSDQLIIELRKDINFLRNMVSPDFVYSYSLAPNSGLVGSVKFYPITSIQHGFTTSPEMFGKSMNIEVIKEYCCNAGEIL